MSPCLMKKFIYNLSLFCLILLVINSLLYLAYKDLYLDEYIKTPDGFKSYILSDSHGLPIDAYAEEFGIYNFSAGSDSYIDMKRKLNYLIKRQKVDTVFIQIEGQVLSNFREHSNNADRSIYYTSLNDYKSTFKYIKEAYIKYYIIFLNPKSQSLFNYYIMSKIYSLLGQNNKRNNTDWKALSNKKKEELALARAEQFYSSELSKSHKEAFENIIDICKTNNIELIGIKFPLPDEYLDVLSNPINHVIYNRFQRADSILLSYNLKVINFEKAFKGKNHLFQDEDHLSTDGGRLLADSLKTLIRDKKVK